jgi:hypothetical protein
MRFCIDGVKGGVVVFGLNRSGNHWDDVVLDRMVFRVSFRIGILS